MKVRDLIKELEPYKNDYLLLSVSNENFLTDVQKYSKYRRCAKRGNIEQWSFDKFQAIAKESHRITKQGGVVVWVV